MAVTSRKRASPPNQAALQQRREEIHKRHQEALAKVEALVKTQDELGRALDGELKAMKGHESALADLEAQQADDSMLASLMRRFTARRVILGRRSVAEGLLKQYELASLRLRQASAFSDELRLTALELQEQVDGLHRERVESAGNQRLSAERVLQVEAELEALEAGTGNFTDAERARRIDQLSFELREESLNMELFRVAEQLAADSLQPARALRDTVMELNEGMSGYVMKASGAVDNAGRRIQALGMAADAPLVVAELQESLSELGTAMEVTQTYVEQTQALLVDVLPDLSRRVSAEVNGRNLLLADSVSALSREKARAEADRRLRIEAEAEVEQWLEEGEEL
ncbi:MAG: hypothetical protein VX899_06980 [Myxococcota bacterium]|nr:hypothetical protein [Myxococcota bacterium]